MRNRLHCQLVVMAGDRGPWRLVVYLASRHPTAGNTMIMGTVSYPDEACYALAARRSVITTTQHFTPLGINT
jgi:hypothetical protein